MEVPRSEERTTSSSLGDTSDHRSIDVANTQGEGREAMDPCESSHNYVFGPSTIIVGSIWHLALLGYFTEGAA
jgi:hypothetical protein